MEMSSHQNQIEVSDCAISVSNVTKYYHKNSVPILNQLNLTVPKGTIYSLLGPSGCGKTTLLRCILGLADVENGDIEVFGRAQVKGDRGILGANVGYMPQDVALAEDLTIGETFIYYGSLVGMSRKQIKSRAKYLVKFLHLPLAARFVGQLSGGQKRRVSFATAILHEPGLLILDEPTVGVDPPLRQKMWNYLSSLVREGHTSVIITTHYIEEARSSQLVGMMLNGNLLAESPPEQLISQYNKTTLEDVFLHLCLLSHENSKDEDSDEDVSIDLHLTNQNVQNVGSMQNDSNGNFTMVSPQFKGNQVEGAFYDQKPKTATARRRIGNFLKPPSLYRLWAVVLKNIMKIYHHPGSVMYQLILPAVLITCVCLSIGGEFHDLKLGVINEDNDIASDLFLASLDPSVIQQRSFSNYMSAYKAVQDGEALGIVQLGPNFTHNIISRYIHGVENDMSLLEHSRIDVTLDNSNSLIHKVLMGQLYAGFQKSMKTALQRVGVYGLLGDIPIKLSKPIYGTLNSTFKEYFVPGIAIGISFFLTMDATSMSLLIERRSGQMERSIVSGVTAAEIILGNLVSQTFINIVQSALITLFMLGIFGIPSAGPAILLTFIITVQGLSGLSYGIFISAVCNKEHAAIMFTLFTVMPTLILSGIMWPLDGMPVLFQKISYALPTTLSSQALRGVMGHGWTFTNATVLIGIGACLGWFVVFILVSILLFRRFW